MASRDEARGDSLLARVLPEQRVYVRTGQRTRYFALSPVSQLAVAAVMVAGLGWGGFSTHSFVTRAVDDKGLMLRLASMEEAYEARIDAMEARQIALEEELNLANTRRDAATSRLSEKQQTLVQTTHQLREAETELAALRARVDSLAAERDEATASLDRISGELMALQISRADSDAAREGIAASLSSMAEAIDRVISERDFAVARRETLSDRLVELETEIGALEGRQDRLLGELESATTVGLGGLERMFERVDLDLDRIMRDLKRDYSGSGGPYEPLEDGETVSDEGDQRVAALIQDLERVNLMRFAADRLPFLRPVNGGRFTSGFGPRRDPKRRRVAMHAGIDIAGPQGTPILATAEGVVTFAGRQRGYGNVIKIRHAFGFETVYAHLSRVRVTVGQRVGRGDLIGDMGSTGRSTGTHLHYEVRIDKEPVNPMKFIEAARDVL